MSKLKSVVGAQGPARERENDHRAGAEYNYFALFVRHVIIEEHPLCPAVTSAGSL